MRVCDEQTHALTSNLFGEIAFRGGDLFFLAVYSPGFANNCEDGQDFSVPILFGQSDATSCQALASHTRIQPSQPELASSKAPSVHQDCLQVWIISTIVACEKLQAIDDAAHKPCPNSSMHSCGKCVSPVDLVQK